MKKTIQPSPDFCFCTAGEAIAGRGEDAWYYNCTDAVSIVSVFDGCGGIGARRYENYSGFTGAFVASRAAAGAAEAWFRTGAELTEASLRAAIDRALQVCGRYEGPRSGLRGSLSAKDFPTTMALITAFIEGQELRASCFWAGDSRCYLLDGGGLRQLSLDDVEGSDALANLTDDGVLKNVINAGTPFRINERAISCQPPCLLFSATDGCFGYIPSPMQFEYLLLDSLRSAGSLEEWDARLGEAFRSCAGDDFTLCIAGFGFGSYAGLQHFFKDRVRKLETQYIEPLGRGVPAAELWSRYQKDYYLQEEST